MADRAPVEALLRAVSLPTAGAADCLCDAFVALARGEVVGVAAIERHGALGLLRSVAVASPWRGRGLARQLCTAGARRAASSGVTELYLLTEDAAGFFASLGFHACMRADAPRAIRESEEFRSLCPDSATLMRRSLV